MTLEQITRRVRLLEARNHGSDYVLAQDAIDRDEEERAAKLADDAAVRAELDAQPKPPVRRFVGESDEEYTARVFGA